MRANPKAPACLPVARDRDEGQLYYAITKTPSASGEYDYSWTWYDGAGSRVMAVQGHGDAPTPQDPHDYWSRRVYFLEDGPNVQLQLGPDGVLERHVTAGLDAPVAVRRYSDAGPLLGTWTLVSDRQGSTLGALDSLGAQIAAAQAVSRNPFGAVEGLAPAGSDAPVSGYTGAAQSVSNGGGMVYLRNRWYDPQSGRFLTQDPIGLAGGVNLYAYAGNDPIAFSDPFGLQGCRIPPTEPCPILEAKVRIEVTPQIKEAAGPLKVGLALGPTVAVSGLIHVSSDGVRVSNVAVSGGLKAEATVKAGGVEFGGATSCEASSDATESGCGGQVIAGRGSVSGGTDGHSTEGSVGPVSVAISATFHAVNAFIVALPHVAEDLKHLLTPTNPYEFMNSSIRP